MTDYQPLNPLTLPLRGSSLIEASAGTGKTWTLAALYLRLVLGHGDTAFADGLAPKQILVLTFTRAATRELRERIRARLAQTADLFRQVRDCPADERNDLINKENDSFLRNLVTASQDFDRDYQRCNKAAQDMDQAAIFTINSFCQRALKRFAFAAGHAFEQQVQTDTGPLLEQIHNDYWRRFIQPLPASILKALAAHSVSVGQSHHSLTTPQVLARVISNQKISAAENPQQGPFPTEIEELQPALQQRDEAHEKARAALADQWQPFNDWLQEQLTQKHLSGRSYQDKPFASLRDFVDNGKVTSNDLEKFTPDGFMWAKGKEQPLPATLDAPRKLAEFLELHQNSKEFPLEILLQHAADWVAVEEEKRLDAQSSITFTTMVTHLAQALTAADGQTLADQLFAAWPCALIDEFQDTDASQYSIFQRIYAQRPIDQHAWLMIGDPKQSIYRFRGADIDTYLRAGDAADNHYTLDTNFRSSTNMVAASNRLFHTSPLEQESAGVFDNDAIRYREVKANGRQDTFLLNGQPVPALTLCYPDDQNVYPSGRAVDLLADHCARRVATLLQQAQQGTALFAQDKEAPRPLQPSDIACLVRTGTQAEKLKNALTERGVDAVYLADKSNVYASNTARDLYYLLVAIANPSDGRCARQALATDLMAYDSDTLVHELQDDGRWLAHLQHLRQLHDVWLRQGVLPMLYRLVHLFALPERQRDERVLTDLFHLAELLQQASTRLDGTDALIAHLQAAIAGKVGDDDTTDDGQNAQQLRLENERNRVIIMTLHGSKGLEFPLVMLPFASVVESEKRRDDPAEDMRLLYVGITRAAHACWLGLLPCRSGTGKVHELETNPLGRLLFGSSHQDSTSMAARLARLCEQAGGDIHLDTSEPPDSHFQPEATTQQVILPELPGPRVPEHWSVTSYSRLTRQVQRGHFNAASERLLESGDDDMDTASTPLSIHQLARGRATGNLLHTLLEAICRRGFGRVTASDIAQLVERHTSQTLPDTATKALLTDWLERLITTPLPLGDNQVALADVEPALAESEFWLRLQQAPLEQLDQLAHQYLPGAREALQPQQLNGMLKGFIDLLFCVDGRYYLLDYKSNHLGDNDSAYSTANMTHAMLAHRYELQGLLYQLALHRLLRLRLPDYDPARHLGGSLFFFLRGIDSDSRGLVHLPVQLDLLEQLDALFDDATSGADA